MCDFDLAWNTFSFHAAECSKLEDSHFKDINDLNNLILNNPDLRSLNKKRIKKELLLDTNSLLTAYKKQMDAIDDLIDLNKEGKIPKDLEIDMEYLFSLKNITATLSEELKASVSRLLECLSE